MHLAVTVPALGLEGQGIGQDRFKVPVGTHVCLHFVLFLFTSCSTPTFSHFLMQVSKTAELGRGSSVVVHVRAYPVPGTGFHPSVLESGHASTCLVILTMGKWGQENQ